MQLTSEVKRVKKHDKDGKPLLVPEWPARSWETRTFGNMEVLVDVAAAAALLQRSLLLLLLLLFPVLCKYLLILDVVNQPTDRKSSIALKHVLLLLLLSFLFCT